MARLPTPGADAGDWGRILNEYLSQVHADDGTLKPNVVGAGALAPNAVNVTNLQNAAIGAAKLDAGSGVDGDVLVKSEAASGGMKWATPTAGGGSVTSVAVGGDLTGTVGNAQIADGAVDENALAQAVKDKLNAGGTGGSDIANGSITYVKLASSNTPLNGSVLSYDGTAFNWITPQAAGGSGEVNTATNVGTAGVGVFKQKTGVDLEFRSINSASPALLSVTESTDKNSVDITLTAGQANGLATLGADGKVPAGQLPAGNGGTTGGGFGFTIKQITEAAYAASVGEYIIADPVAGKITISLPTQATNGFIRIKRIGTNGTLNSVEVSPGQGSFIDGSEVGTHVLNSQYESIEFWSDGTNWYR